MLEKKRKQRCQGYCISSPAQPYQ